MAVRLPGIQYADIDERGVPHGVLDFPHGDGLLRQVRCSRSGRLLAGITQQSPTVNVDEVWELEIATGRWRKDSRSPFGPGSVIYRGEELLVHQQWPADGFRYIDDLGRPITRTSTYAHPTLKVWEYTVLPNGWIVGQGGKGVWGEDPIVIYPGDARRRLIQTGKCRWINAYLVGGRLDLAWQQDGKDCDARSLTLGEVLDLPEAPWSPETPPVDPPPPPPDPPEEPEPMDISRYLVDRTDVVEGVKRDYPHLRGGAIVDQVAHRLNREHGVLMFGRKARRSNGGDPNADALTVKRHLTDFSQKALIDILGNAWPGDPNDPDKPIDVPGWDVRPEHEEPGNGYWTRPVNADLDNGVPPPPPPPQDPPGECAGCAALRAELATVRNLTSLALDELGKVLEAHGLRLDALEAHPGPAPTLPPLEAAGKVSLSDVLYNRPLVWTVRPKE